MCLFIINIHLYFFIHVCTFSWLQQQQQQQLKPHAALLIAAYFSGGLYVCHRATLSSLSPRKNRNTPSSSCSSSLCTPPISLRLHPALIRPCSHAGKMTERGTRESGEGGRERDDSSSTSVERERGRERDCKKKKVLF